MANTDNDSVTNNSSVTNATTWTGYNGNNWFNDQNWTNGAPTVSSSGTMEGVVIPGGTTGPTLAAESSNYSNQVNVQIEQSVAGSMTTFSEYQIDGQAITLTNGGSLNIQGLALGAPASEGGVATGGGVNTIFAAYLTPAGSATPVFDTLASIVATGTASILSNDIDHNFGFIGASGAGNTLGITLAVGGHDQSMHGLVNYGEIDAAKGGVVDLDVVAPPSGYTNDFYNEGWVLADGGTVIANSVNDSPNSTNANGVDGYIEISHGGDAVLGTVASTEQVVFSDSAANTLDLTSAADFDGSVKGFGPNQTIKIDGFSGTANVTVQTVNGVTELVTDNGGTDDIITLAGTTAPFYTAETITQNGTTSEILTDGSNFTFSGKGSTTSWFNGGNWNGGVSPGQTVHSGETVSIPTGHASIGGSIVTDNGTIAVTGSHSSLTDTTSLAGDGTIFIDHGAQVTLANSTGNDGSITVDFGTHGSDAHPNVLDVNGNTLGFGGTIAGFGSNDQIILGNHTEPTPGGAPDVTLNYNSVTHELTVTDTVSGHTYTESLHLTGTFDTNPSNTLYDSVGPNGITLATGTGYTFTGTGTTTSWFNGGNWNGGVSPGKTVHSGETVSLPTGHASIGGTIVTDNGTIGVTGPGTSLTDTTSLAGNGTIFIDHGAQVTLANPTGNDGSITVDFGTHGSNADPNVLDVNGSSRGFGGTIAGFGPNDQIILGNSTEPTPGSTSAVQLHWNSTTGELTVTDTVSGHTYTESLHLTGTFDTDPANTLYDSVGKGGITISVPCFAEGTRILTEHGEVPVEALEVGDEVTIGREGSERTRRIVWIGHRHIALDRVRDRSKVEPVRILAGAFGANLPARDLTVSPDHALFVDGVLIEAKNLVNGATILRDRAARQVTYYHVELDAHDVLLAEGLPAESYLDDANRAMFANGADAMTLHPDFATRAGAPRCAELLLDGEPVQAVRMLLDTRARELLGLRTTDRPDVTLFANGAAIATRYGTAGTLRFVLPAGVTSATLAVPTGVPAEVNPATGDRRELGLKIVSATLIEAEGRRPVGFEAMDGLFAADDHRGRWSGGLVRIALPEHAEARILEIVYDAVATRWEAVEVAESAIA